jgi:HAD superfamily hydrolase (TIGR01549 family)
MQNAYAHKGPEMLSYIKKYNEIFESQLEHYDPNPNIVNFIKNDTTHVLYLWSSNCRITVEKTLKMEGILHHFETLVTSSDVSFIKPETEGFSHIYIQGNNLDDYLFIGDSKADKEAAKKIGIDFFEINYFSLIA